MLPRAEQHITVVEGLDEKVTQFRISCTPSQTDHLQLAIRESRENANDIHTCLVLIFKAMYLQDAMELKVYIEREIVI